VFRGRLLLTITAADIRAYIGRRQAAGAANGTINRELSALGRMFSLAVNGKKLYDKPSINKLEEAPPRRGFFERETFEAVRRHLPENLRGLVTFAYITGWRVGSEVQPLEWRQIDWNAREVRLDPGTTKNRAGRVFPFTQELEKVLLAQLAEHERQKNAGRLVPHVFHRNGTPIRCFRGAWRTACRRAGCLGRIPHDFRRTAVRNLELAGVSHSAAKAMVGHKTESMYKRYAIVDSATLRDAAAKIDRAMGTLPGTPDDKAASSGM
jgi:integrase